MCVRIRPLLMALGVVLIVRGGARGAVTPRGGEWAGLVVSALNDTYRMARGAVLEIPAPGVLGNDSGAYEAVLVSAPANGTLTLLPHGGFRYEHNGSTGASVTFTYAARGDAGEQVVGTVTIELFDVGFTRSLLTGHTLTLPSSLQFGPDGRLYALRKLGHVEIMQVTRFGPNDYRVSQEEVLTLVRSILNHDDDGYPNTVEKNRQATGLLVAGTASNPVVYVSSSDPRVGGGTNEPDTWLDTNSGVISKLTWIGSSRTDPAGFWEKIDLVRGLPRSEENHAPNGMQLSLTGDTLFVASGGFTNAGAPSNSLVYISEYALSGAILSLHLPTLEAMSTKTDANGQKYKYDLPTLDDPTRANVNGITNPSLPGYDGIDVDDPWGGNDGMNQAKLVAGGPVQIHSPGYRNAYDLVIQRTTGREGRMYTIDNGANKGWGGHPVGEGTYPGPNAGKCTNAYDPAEPGSKSPGPNDPVVNNENGLHFVRELKPGDQNYVAPGQRYYAGHPNPIRANPAGAGLYTGDYNATPSLNTGVWRTSTSGTHPLPVDWPPVPVSMANPAECDFRNSGETDGALLNFAASTNGLAEYRASNFTNRFKGNLLAAAWNTTHVDWIRLNAAGDSVLNATPTGTEVFAQGFGTALLDVAAQGDSDVFPGTIWVADFSGHTIHVFEPADYGSIVRHLGVSASRLAFGAPALGSSTVHTLTLSNPVGNAPLTISSIAKSGANAGDFTVSPAAPMVIAPGDKVVLTITFSPAALGLRAAALTLTHDGSNGPTRVDLVGAGGEGDAPSVILHRINAGGHVAFDGGSFGWQADRLDEPHAYNNAEAGGEATYTTADPIAFDVSVPAGTPSTIFQTGRVDAAGGQNLQWNIPVPTGQDVEIRFYFAEPFFTAPNVPPSAGWPRSFDIRIDGATPSGLAAIDLFKEVGHDKGLVKSFAATSDGNLDIDFVAGSGEPILQGIEILALNAPWASYRKGWNLVGLPTDPSTVDYAAVYETLAPLTPTVTWDGLQYVPQPTLTPGVAYWLDARAMRTQLFEGASIPSISLSLEEGWNMISGPNCAVPFGAIADPGGILIDGTLYTFDGMYRRTETLAAGHGYWVLASGDGGVTLTCGVTGLAAKADEPIPSDAGVLAVWSDAGRQTLVFGAPLADGEAPDRYALPPRASASTFDVRFATDRWREAGTEAVIRIQSPDALVRLVVESLPLALGPTLLVEELGLEGVRESHVLSIGEPIEIDPSQTNRLRIQALAESTERPERFSLLGNYPNPFNPTTSIVFDLPEEAAVEVAVYDLLGHQVLALPARTFEAGSGRRLTVDASTLASGVYVYRLLAGREARSGRFVVLK